MYRITKRAERDLRNLLNYIEMLSIRNRIAISNDGDDVRHPVASCTRFIGLFIDRINLCAITLFPVSSNMASRKVYKRIYIDETDSGIKSVDKLREIR